MKITYSPKVKSVDALKSKENLRNKLLQDILVKNSPASFASKGSLTQVTKLSCTSDNLEFVDNSLLESTITKNGLNNLSSSGNRLESVYQKEPVRRMLHFDCIENERQIHQFSRFKTAPIANSTMIDPSDRTLIAEHHMNEFVPAAQSTMINEFIPCTSSTMLEKKAILTASFSMTTTGTTDIEIWSINENDETTLLQNNYLRHNQLDQDSTCYSHDLLSTIAASTICRDEFSLDAHHHQQANFNIHKNLPRTSTVTQLQTTMVQSGSKQVNDTQCKEAEECKEKKQPKFGRLIQAMKTVRKGLTKKAKNIDKIETKQHKPIDMPVFKQPQPLPEVYIQDKQAVAKKLHRFRESFRRKDTRQIQTLATL